MCELGGGGGRGLYFCCVRGVGGQSYSMRVTVVSIPPRQGPVFEVDQVRVHSTVCAFSVSWISQQDVHDRYRTEAHQDVVARFNQR